MHWNCKLRKGIVFGREWVKIMNRALCVCVCVGGRPGGVCGYVYEFMLGADWAMEEGVFSWIAYTNRGGLEVV